MKKLFAILFAILLVSPLVAQQQTGNIYGKIVDEDGIPLPGVAVTLFGTKIAPIPMTSSSEGIFRFLSLYPSKGYAIKLELDGFKTKTETGIIVAVGKNTELVLTMEVGTLEEEVTVVAVSPVIDTKKTAISTTLNYELLQSVPIVRDPWVILQMTPAIQVDRENVGGNESGQQSAYVALGGNGNNDTWTMDGINITDPAAMGASPGYYDYDTFEEVNVTIGGADVEQQSGGVSINLVTRRGENRVSFAGRFYYTENYFQAEPHGATYEEIEKIFPGYGYNKIRDIKDYGFNIGGPLLKDKIWWWGSYGIQDIKIAMINGSNDDTVLTNYVGKLNLQIIPENRLELFIHSASKLKWGRSSGSSYPAGYNQHGKYHFGSPIIKIQDEHMFGDSLFVSAKYGFFDGGFGLWPGDDEELTRIRTYDVANVLCSSNAWFFSGRPFKNFTLHGIYYKDNFLGGSHEIKIGFEFADRRDEWTSGYAGNMRYNFNYNFPTVDWDGDGTRDIMRDKFGIDLRLLHLYSSTWQGGPEGCYNWSGFLSDTASWGRMTIKLGIRYDYQVSFTKGMDSRVILFEDTEKTWWENYYEIQQKVLGPSVSNAISGIFPESKIPEVKTSDTIPWISLSPRLGLTYDISGDGRTIAKLSGAHYGARMSSWPAYLWQRGGGWGQYLHFWWNDANGDEQTQFNELYWADYSTSLKSHGYNNLNTK